MNFGARLCPFWAIAGLAILSMLGMSGHAAPAITQDVGGVPVENSITVQGTTLQLNGAGVRYKAVFKVYTAALYLGKRVSTPEAVMGAPGHKRLVLTMLRDIDANELGRLFTKGVESNVPVGELTKMIPQLVRMGQIFSDQKHLKAGDTLLIEWVPGTGTVITSKGVVQGEPFKDLEFFNGMLRIWLGKSPADQRLKDALLGKPPEPLNNAH
jgi:hypothetical protein